LLLYSWYSRFWKSSGIMKLLKIFGKLGITRAFHCNGIDVFRHMTFLPNFVSHERI
jgi:hypothetical protein